MTDNHSTISLIAAVGRRGEIGCRGDHAFHIRADLRRFKQLTLGKPVIMGRRTFESLPKGALPERRNIVITSNVNYSAPGIETADSLEKALAMTAEAPEIMIIGGGQVYAAALPLATRIYLTEVDASLDEADTFFPGIDRSRWSVAIQSDRFTDEATGLPYRFTDLVRQ